MKVFYIAAIYNELVKIVEVKKMKNEKIELKTGSYNLNDQPNFNYQLNRTIMWSGGDIEDIKKVASKIVDSASWKRELIGIGNKACSEGRIKEAIAYYRMSEFFMYDGDPDKKKYYQLAVKMFYDYYKDYFDKNIVIRYDVKFENVFLPVMYAKAKGKEKIQFFCMEEMILILKNFSFLCCIYQKMDSMCTVLKVRVKVELSDFRGNISLMSGKSLSRPFWIILILQM